MSPYVANTVVVIKISFLFNPALHMYADSSVLPRKHENIETWPKQIKCERAPVIGLDRSRTFLNSKTNPTV